MSESAPTEAEPEHVMPIGGVSGSEMTVSDVTGLVHLFNGMLVSMEGRLIAKIDETSRLAAERWAAHDLERLTFRELDAKRFEKLEQAIFTVEITLKQHLDKERDEDLVLDARVRPIKSVGGYIIHNWRTLLLAILAVLAILGITSEAAQPYLNP